MSKLEQWKFEIMMDFINGKINRKEAAKLLDLSSRQVSRLAKKTRKSGLRATKHGNSGRRPSNSIDSSIKLRAMELTEKHYFDFNVTHLREKLLENHHLKISYMTLLRWCREKNLVKRRHKRRAKIRYYRERMPCEGLLLQFDGSHHKWNGYDKWCLIGAIDDATSDIPYAEFFTSEDTLNCMRVMQKIIERKGIPQALYVDRAGWFGGTKRQDFAQFKRACEELGIRIIFANSPQAKGRIERTWNTMQDRLIPEMRIRNIRRFPAANSFIQEQFIPNYWEKQCKVQPQNLELKYRPVPIHIKLSEVFCIKDTRVVNSNETVSINSELYTVESNLGFSLRKQKIEIRTYQDLTWKTFYAGKEIQLMKLMQLRKYGT